MNIYEVHKANPDVFTQLTLKDQLFCYYECPQKEKIIQLYSNHNQITFTLSGQRRLHHGDRQWTLTQEKGFLVKRGAFFQEITDDYSDWKVLVLYLKDDYLKKVFEEFRPHFALGNLPKVNPQMIQEFELNDKIINSCKGLIPYFTNPKLLPDSIFEGKFKELLFNLLLHPSNTQVLAYIHQIIDDYTIPIWEVMEANYAYDLKISEFAEIANRSTSTFRRDFEKYYQTSPGKWLTEKRLAKATRLLETSQKPISDITFECGFKNVSHFSKIFKVKYQLSPTAYRELHTSSVLKN